MICPRCTMTNRQGAIYCRRCGQLLASTCPRCHADVLSDADFRDQCGLGLTPNAQFIWSSGQPAQAREADEPVGVAAPHEQPAAITPKPLPAAKRPRQTSEPAEPGLAQYLQQFIPKELISKLEVARASGGMVGERRVVTMLFCDVKGSTAAAESLDPEEWSEIINPSFEYMIRPVYKFEGTVARLMGDGILAFFGAPIAHEDDPQRAVRAGLEIANGFAPYREQVQASWGINLNVRVGINTGLVLVGEVGSDLQMEYTALGDAINLAARMEQTAQQGTVQIAENTYRRVANLFEFEDLGLVEIKGKDEPIHTYRPLWSKAQRIRVRGAAELQAPLIGRGSEWSALSTAADAAARGVGQIVFLIGEAGLGKSRLIQELQKREGPAEPRCEWYETTSLSYETSQP
jgi:class 3 adenylate cyclase